MAACILAASACLNGCNDTPPQPSQSPADAAVQAIDERYAEATRRRGSLRLVERDLGGLSTEGGTLKAYFDGNALRLADAILYGETGRADWTFYYDDVGRPSLVHERDSRYDKPFGEIAQTREHRYYFQEGAVIQVTDDGRQVAPDAAEPASRVKQALELSRQLATAAR